MKLEHLKCPLSRWTFSKKPIRDWVESVCVGKVLNLFCGRTKLAVDETRVDMDPLVMPDHCMDALDYLEQCDTRFDTVLLDPPYSFRKSMEMYGGRKASRFNIVKNRIPDVLNPGGRVITFGYHSVSMGTRRGFQITRLLVISHGGAIHDTLATVEQNHQIHVDWNVNGAH